MYKRRLKILFGLLCGAFLLVTMRLVHLQVMGTEKERYGRELPVEPLRGAILDRNGVLLAADRPAFDVAMEYGRLAHPELWVAELEWASGVPREVLLERSEEIIERISRLRARVLERLKPKDPARFRILEETIPHPILADVDWRTVAHIEANPERFCPPSPKRKGERYRSEPIVKIVPRRRREYPFGSLACHVLGYLGKPTPAGEQGWERDHVEARGVSGVERQYQALLGGKWGRRFQTRDVKTRAYRTEEEIPARAGNTIWLTLDHRIQRAAEAALGERTGAVVLMDVHTGELLAMASNPGYDINGCFDRMTELCADMVGKPLLNRAIQDPTPCGSVIKIVTAIAALESGAITPDTTFECMGEFHIGGRSFGCSHRIRHGRVNVIGALQDSCNVFFYQAALRMGGQTLAEWAARFGLGERTGVDLPYEWRGRIPSPESRRHAGRGGWSAGDTLNLSIGQGDVQVTPIQVAVMTAAVANGGWIVQPHLLLRVTDFEGRPLEDASLQNKQPRRKLDVSDQTLEVVRQGLRRVVVAGTARHVAELSSCRAAGKTGTAETADRRINHAWFAGYAPFDVPKVCVVAVLHRVEATGAEKAAPVAAEVLKAYFQAASAAQSVAQFSP